MTLASPAPSHPAARCIFALPRPSFYPISAADTASHGGGRPYPPHCASARSPPQGLTIWVPGGAVKLNSFLGTGMFTSGSEKSKTFLFFCASMSRTRRT